MAVARHWRMLRNSAQMWFVDIHTGKAPQDSCGAVCAQLSLLQRYLNTLTKTCAFIQCSRVSNKLGNNLPACRQQTHPYTRLYFIVSTMVPPSRDRMAQTLLRYK